MSAITITTKRAPQVAITSDIRYCIASTRAERSAAFRLVYHADLRTGLGEANDREMRVTPYHLLPTTDVFLATRDGQVIFTLTLIVDGKLGLPMEVVYPEEIAARRQDGLLIGEVCCRADRRPGFRGSLPVFVRLCRLLAQYARFHRLDALVVACHPGHARFYQRYLDFRAMGGERSYPGVQNQPAVALWLDFDRLRRERPADGADYLGPPVAEAILRPQPMPSADQAYFAPLVASRCVVAGLSGESSGEAGQLVGTA